MSVSRFPFFPLFLTLNVCLVSSEQWYDVIITIGTECLHILVMNNGFLFTEKSWGLFCGTLKSLFESTAPQELMIFEEKEVPAAEATGATTNGVAREKSEVTKLQQQDMFNSIIIKCVVQLELIQTVEWIVLSSTRPSSEDKSSPRPVPRLQQAVTPDSAVCDEASERRQAARVEVLGKAVDRAGDMVACLNNERLLLLLDCLEGSHKFAKTFNANRLLRTALWKAGFMKNRSKPNLLKQETTSLSLFPLLALPSRP